MAQSFLLMARGQLLPAHVYPSGVLVCLECSRHLRRQFMLTAGSSCQQMQCHPGSKIFSCFVLVVQLFFLPDIRCAYDLNVCVSLSSVVCQSSIFLLWQVATSIAFES